MKIETNYTHLVNEWQAWDADSYDGAEDAGRQIVGRGDTERAALIDFINQRAEVEE